MMYTNKAWSKSHRPILRYGEVNLTYGDTYHRYIHVHYLVTEHRVIRFFRKNRTILQKLHKAITNPLQAVNSFPKTKDASYILPEGKTRRF